MTSEGWLSVNRALICRQLVRIEDIQRIFVNISVISISTAKWEAIVFWSRQVGAQAANLLTNTSPINRLQGARALRYVLLCYETLETVYPKRLRSSFCSRNSIVGVNKCAASRRLLLDSCPLQTCSFSPVRLIPVFSDSDTWLNQQTECWLACFSRITPAARGAAYIVNIRVVRYHWCAGSLSMHI